MLANIKHTQGNSGFIQKQTGMCLTWSPRRLLRILSLNVFQTLKHYNALQYIVFVVVFF